MTLVSNGASALRIHYPSCARQNITKGFFANPYIVHSPRNNLYFDKFWNERCYRQHRIFPTPASEHENRVICVSGRGSDIFRCLIANKIVEYKFSCSFNGTTQCFPFYAYDEDGRNRRENISDWALSHFRAHYRDDSITKWDIFHYVYGLLHSPEYRKAYGPNLMLDLPRLPLAPDFWGFSRAGKCLAKIHIGYEHVEEYPLDHQETPGKPLDWRVKKMRLTEGRRKIVYNDFLTLDGVPSTAFDYLLGTRSALEWVIDQYQVKTVDEHYGIIDDPNRTDDPEYIVKLIKKVTTVSLNTVEIVENLPELGVLH